MRYPNKNNESLSHVIKSLLKDVLELDAGVLVKVFTVDSYDYDNLEPKSGAPMLKPLGQRKLVEFSAKDGASFLKETDKFGFEKGAWQYSYQIPAHPMWFNKEEYAYVMEHPRSMSTYGYARTQAILDLIKSLHYSTLYNKRFFEENPIPDGALSLLDTNEVEMKDFMSWWNSEFKAQPHKLAVINKDVKWQPFNISQRELEFLETQKWYYSMIITMFGLTPAEMGITGDLNRATSATQAEVVKRKSIRPFLKLLEAAINKEIIPEFGFEGIEFQFIYDDPSEKRIRLDNWQLELNMGIKTVNEVRNELGLEPVENGDYSNSMQLMAQSHGPQIQQESQEQEETQYPNYEDQRNAAEGKPKEESEKSLNVMDTVISSYLKEYETEFSKTIVKDFIQHDDEEIEQEKNDRVRSPFSDENRPIGSFKSKDGKTMSYDELIEEHKKLVEALKKDNPKEIKQEYEEQKKELEQYIEESKKNTEKKIDDNYEVKRQIMEQIADDIYKVMIASGYSIREASKISNNFKQRARIKKGSGGYGNIGQYYHDPSEVILPNKGKVTISPFSNPSKNDDGFLQLTPSQLGSDFRNLTGRQTYEEEKDRIRCPMCGMNTLTILQAEETGMEDIRCTNCSSRFNTQDLIDKEGLHNMNQMLTAHNSVEPISIPNHSLGKDCDCAIHKSIDEYMTIKQYVGFDTEKSLPQTRNYVDSDKYKELLYSYIAGEKEDNKLTNLKVEKIIQILKESMDTNMRISDIARHIEKVIGDKTRSMLIARTEVARIHNEGNVQRLKDIGIEKVKFMSSPEDGRLCKECGKLNGKIIPINKSNNIIPVHPACRCSLVGVEDWNI
jgi:SPP1 gp7 family putative phage head morphogenesis protein